MAKTTSAKTTGTPASPARKKRDPGTLPRRELNKQEKLRRIKLAARELFLKRGYDEATMREIAKRADVGLGTLFSYASDKRDLLFLIYNDEQDALTRLAFEDADRDDSFLNETIAAFELFYRFFSRQPEFMRFVLRELTFYTAGQQAERFQQGRESIVAGLDHLIRRAKDRGEIRPKENSLAIAELLFGIYQAEVRRWLSERKPSPVDGLKRLRRMFQIVVDGLNAA